jgi:rhodanese-related sulfurtransferase
MKTYTLSVLALLGIGLVLLSGCQEDTSAKWKKGDHLDVNAVTAVAMITKNPEIVVLDVRTPAETTLGKLDQAREIDFHSDDFEKELATLEKTVPYLVYCRSGSRSSQAAAMMKKLNFDAVYNCDDGYDSIAKAQSSKN